MLPLATKGMKISVIIPVKNGAFTLNNCLQSIRDQQIPGIEIIVLDSMSTDASKEIALSHGAIVKDIQPGAFNHGFTRNEGASIASGELLYFTVQDAWIAAPGMLEKMVSHFADNSTAAVVGDQGIPWGHRDKNPASWFKRQSAAEIEVRFFPHPGDFGRLNEREQVNLSSWDNVNAMYRRSALAQIPFRQMDFSEDWLWANEALKAGLKIIRDPSLLVYHYHHMHFGYSFRNHFIALYHLYILFGYLDTISVSAKSLLRIFYRVISKQELNWWEKIYWIMHNISISVARFLSHVVFRAALVLGGRRGLDKVYHLFCEHVPQGVQNVSIKTRNKLPVSS
jgi:rhamnosyltransferase